MRFVLHPAADAAYVHYEGSHANPFEPAAAGVSRANAWWLAEAALLSYWPPGIAIARFRSAGMETAFIEQRGVQCYVSVASAFVIVSFRGTEVDEFTANHRLFRLESMISSRHVISCGEVATHRG